MKTNFRFPNTKWKAGLPGLVFLVAMAATLVLAAPAPADIIPGFGQLDEAQPLSSLTGRKQAPESRFSGNPWPGRMSADLSEADQRLFYQAWPGRSVSYEILLKNKASLAAMVCGLAYFTGDLSTRVPLTRCLRGIQGFHYPIGQIRDWAQALFEGRFEHRNQDPERRLIDWLVAAKALIRTPRGYRAGSGIDHVCGAAPGKKRTLKLNLTHERLHVLWDLDPAFKARNTKIWRANPEIRERFARENRGYADQPESQQLEEWAVRRFETNPPWRD